MVRKDLRRIERLHAGLLEQRRLRFRRPQCGYVRKKLAFLDERNAEYNRMKIRASAMGTMISKRPTASCICSNSPLQIAR